MEDKSRTTVERTIEYYNKNAESFIQSTIGVDMSSLYSEFEKYLSPGCKILDLGCGSGRDSKYFMNKGYQITAIDPSEEMCASTEKISGIYALKMKVEDMTFVEEFDAIWACASLLHTKMSEMKMVLNKCAQSLKKSGYMYASWKYGTGERIDGYRHFSDFDEESIKKVLSAISNIKIVKVWKTSDVRNRNMTVWINVIVKRIY